MNDDISIINVHGCDETSDIYLDSLNFLQPIMLKDEGTITMGAMTIELDKARDMDLSALGVYIGKFVEQEINSSIVQLMRRIFGIKMPKYYCRWYPFGKNPCVKTANDTIRLNEYFGPSKILKMVPLGSVLP